MIEISNEIWFPTEFTISFFSVFSALGFFDGGGICTTGTGGVASVIGARGADTIGGATPTGSTFSGTFMKGNSLFGLNILSLLSTFSLSAFSFSPKIDEGVNSAGGGIGGFSRLFLAMGNLRALWVDWKIAVVMVNWALRDEDLVHLVQAAMEIVETSGELNQVLKEMEGKKETEE